MTLKGKKQSRYGVKKEANEVWDRKQTGEVKERGQEVEKQDVGIKVGVKSGDKNKESKKG